MPKTVDLTGRRFGNLVVEKIDHKNARKDKVWKCVCDCGNVRMVTTSNLMQSRTTACKECAHRHLSESKIKDISGNVYGRLTAIKRLGNNKKHSSVWLCKCECGTYCKVDKANLLNGCTQSCGCLHKETFTTRTHGQTKTRLYRIWRAMRERCKRKEAINYRWYGGKGIRVCSLWENNFEAFRDWAKKNGYRDGLTIDRIDPCKNYEPNNCRWLTREENARRAAVAGRKKNVQKSD